MPVRSHSEWTTNGRWVSFSSVEVFHQHDIVFKTVHFRIKKPSTIGRNGETWRSQLKFYLDRRNPRRKTCREVEEVNGGMRCRLQIHEVNALIMQGPKPQHGPIEDEYLITACDRYPPDAWDTKALGIVNKISIK